VWNQSDGTVKIKTLIKMAAERVIKRFMDEPFECV
jgi:hypothetical protein